PSNWKNSSSFGASTGCETGTWGSTKSKALCMGIWGFEALNLPSCSSATVLLRFPMSLVSSQ
ncbi:hypothetical protein IRJ41_013284, partial [Triplophysa rosa]